KIPVSVRGVSARSSNWRRDGLRLRHEKTGKTVPLPDESSGACGTDARCGGRSLNASKAGQSAETDFLVGTGTVLPVFSCAVSAAPKPRLRVFAFPDARR
ncbi:MAG TPA: hypothetical protein VMV69_04485, partial [Pirellulales bacterium]|nr:hypothetical protein [Pirellulales bacterium]